MNEMNDLKAFFIAKGFRNGEYVDQLETCYDLKEAIKQRNDANLLNANEYKIFNEKGERVTVYVVAKSFAKDNFEDYTEAFEILDTAKKACDKARNDVSKEYKVFDETGNVIYPKNKKVLIVLFMILAVGLVAGGFAYSYFNRDKDPVTDPNEQERFTMTDGTVIEYKRGEVLIPYEDGTIVIPDGGAVIYKPGGEKVDVPGGTIIKPDGTIVIPDKDCGVLARDRYGNIHVKGCGATIIFPNKKEEHLDTGSIIVPGNTAVDPNGPGELTVNENGHVIVGEGGAKIITGGCENKEAPAGSYILLNGIVVIPKVSGETITVDAHKNVIIPAGGASVFYPKDCSVHDFGGGAIIVPGGTVADDTKGNGNTRVDEDGRVIIEDGGKVVLPTGKEKDVPAGTIVLPDGTVIEGTNNSKPTINDKNNDGKDEIVIPPGGVITYPDGREEHFPNGGEIDEDGNITKYPPKEPEKPVACTRNCDTNGDGVCDYNCYNDDNYCYLNCDTNNDNKCDLNCDNDNDGKCNYNCDTNGDNKCDVNCYENGTCVKNCDFNNDSKCDLNCDTNDDGKCDLNCDTNKDGKCDVNCDTNGDGTCDVNCYDDNGKCLKNCDTNGDGKCDKNCDLDKDGVCDYNCYDNNDKCIKNCDTNNDNVCDYNCYDDEGVCVKKCDTNGDGVCDLLCPPPDPELSILFTEGANIEAYGVRPGWNATKTFTVKNTGEDEVRYNILWTKVVNEYVRYDDLVFTLKRNGVTIVNEGRLPTVNAMMQGNILLELNGTHNYELTMSYKNTGDSQNIDQGKLFSTVLQITAG